MIPAFQLDELTVLGEGFHASVSAYPRAGVSVKTTGLSFDIAIINAAGAEAQAFRAITKYAGTRSSSALSHANAVREAAPALEAKVAAGSSHLGLMTSNETTTAPPQMLSLLV
jgi:hypothetical protein